MSTFRKEVLNRYGNGRLQFTVKEDPKCNFECTKRGAPTFARVSSVPGSI
jgi:hypothetical protein